MGTIPKLPLWELRSKPELPRDLRSAFIPQTREGLEKPLSLKLQPKRLLGQAVVVICFACLLWTLRNAGTDLRTLPHPKPIWLAAALVMFLVHYLMQAMGWHAILRSLGETGTARLSMRMWYASLIARWMPGRVWYTASRLMLARQNGLSVEAVSLGIVLELAYILVGGLLVTVAFAGKSLASAVSGGGGVAAEVFVLLFVAGAAAAVLRPSGLAKLASIGFVRRLMRKVAGRDVMEAGMPTMSTSRSILLVGYYTLFWLYSGVMFGVLALAFIPMTRETWAACIPAFPGSWLVGFFSLVTPAGLGAREGALWVMLRHAMPQSDAVVLAISSRLMMVAAELLSVGVAYLLLKGPVAVTGVKPEPIATHTAVEDPVATLVS